MAYTSVTTAVPAAGPAGGGEQMGEKTAVVLVNWNGAAATRRCVEFILGDTPPSYGVVLVDNASKPNEYAAISDLQGDRVLLIRSEENLGITGGMSLGVRHALESGARYIILMNNDGIPDRGTTPALVEFLRSNPTVGAVGPLIRDLEKPDHISYWGRRLGRVTGALVDLDRPPSEPTDVEMLEGSCMACRAEPLQALGGPSQQFFGYWEDMDLSIRIWLSGWRVVVLPSATFFHVGSGFTPSRGKLYLMARNRFVFYRRIAGSFPVWWYAFYSIAIVLPKDVAKITLRNRSLSLAVLYMRGTFDGIKAVVQGLPPLFEKEAYRFR